MRQTAGVNRTQNTPIEPHDRLCPKRKTPRQNRIAAQAGPRAHCPRAGLYPAGTNISPARNSRTYNDRPTRRRVSAEQRLIRKTAFPSMRESRFDVPFLKRGGGLCPCELASLRVCTMRAYALRRLSINPIAANGYISPRRHSGTNGDLTGSDLWPVKSCDRTNAPI